MEKFAKWENPNTSFPVCCSSQLRFHLSLVIMLTSKAGYRAARNAWSKKTGVKPRYDGFVDPILPYAVSLLPTSQALLNERDKIRMTVV